MRTFGRIIRVFFAALWLAVAAFSQASGGANGRYAEPASWHSTFSHPYYPKDVAPVHLGNSGRLEALLRGGKLYLSLQDAIALALENNLDIEIQRYGIRQAENNLKGAKAGGTVRGVSTSLSSASSSTSTSSSATSSLTSGATSAGTTSALSTSGIPSLDPVITGTTSWGHFTSPQVNSFLVGANSVISTNKTANFAIQQGFLTGTRTSLFLNNRNSLSSSGRADFNPSTTAAMGLSITQPLLMGWGRALNSRGITIAKNNIAVSDLVFRRQVIATVSQVITLYWDLVSANEEVKVRQKALTLSQKLYDDNRKQVEIGTLAPIEIVRAEAEVAARQQDLLVAETQVLQQATVLKNYLSRTGVASPALAESQIIPTDRIQIPENEKIEPIQDLVTRAMDNRPELAQIRIQLENSKLNIKAVRNSMLPELDAFVNLQNNALSGQINTLPVPSVGGLPATPRSPTAVDPFFLGGYGNALGQLFRRNFPDYSVGIQFSIPLRNRAAQADMINAQLSLRQSEIQQQQQVNQIRVEVQNGLIGVQQARSRYQSALKNRVLAEQTLDAEQKKYALGASTIFFVIQAQRDLATAQFGEVAAMSAYARARVELERATGVTLTTNNIEIQEALNGQVSRKPSPLPVLDQP